MQGKTPGNASAYTGATSYDPNNLATDGTTRYGDGIAHLTQAAGTVVFPSWTCTGSGGGMYSVIMSFNAH
jgi:hypothetical protein